MRLLDTNAKARELEAFRNWPNQIIVYLTGGVIGRHGPKGANYTGGNGFPRALPVGPLLYKLFYTRN